MLEFYLSLDNALWSVLRPPKVKLFVEQPEIFFFFTEWLFENTSYYLVL